MASRVGRVGGEEVSGAGDRQHEEEGGREGGMREEDGRSGPGKGDGPGW